MGTSNAVINPGNMELTPMRVNFKGVDLGGTLKNVSVKIETMKADIVSDQTGATVLDRRTYGLNISVVTELAEVQLKDNWKVVFPHARLVNQGGLKQMYFENSVGDGDLANAGVLILHPLSKLDSDLSEDIKCFKACADAKSELVYGPKDQVSLKITWNILLDTGVVPGRFLIYGDPTIGLVAAVAGTPAYVGTGNGTMTGVVVVNGVTKTEVITATCIHAAANAGIFQISGSVSGPLGNATVGVGFSSSVIGFTINDGTTDFIVGDAFTVATTASNYV